ncbi:hypothetical protein AXI76_gp082 [Pseudoalteromonas phage H101]|uniref:Uncharacterized protein n=1 Tax=Pseudoalteromonas phage H101 TaxID=1654919 RepID=A0A0H4IRS4_9CAUD|nr:hypothetical protein AXI76_gp082 [Pseudoalteromonas phage H101]AKO60983.1 hypothetical protein [Pseudoalteromonas phage H101]
MYSQLKAKIQKSLGQNCTFTLDDGEQSFVTAPTNHIHLVDDFYSVKVGHVVYSNVTEYDQVLTNIKNIVDHCKTAQDEIGDYIQVVYLQGRDHPWRVVFGGFDNDLQDFDFEELDQLLNKLKTFEF